MKRAVLGHVAPLLALALGLPRLRAPGTDASSPPPGVVVDWEGRFSTLELGPGTSWRWCGRSGRIVLGNTSDRPIAVAVSFDLELPAPGIVHVSGLVAAEVSVAGKAHVAWPLELPSGKSTIELACDDAKPVIAPGDPRELVFLVRDFELH